MIRYPSLGEAINDCGDMVFSSKIMVVLDTERLDRASTKLVMMVNSEGCPARSAAEWAGIMIPTENRLDSFAGVIAFLFWRIC